MGSECFSRPTVYVQPPGISIGGNISSWNFPLSESSQAKASFCSDIKWCTSFLSSGHRKSPWWTLSIASIHSVVYLPFGSKSGGFGFNSGIPANGSPVIFLTILNCSGKVPITGFTLSATGLYFLVANWAVSVQLSHSHTSLVLRFQHFSAQASAHPLQYHPIFPTLPDSHPILPIYLFLFLHLPIILIFSYVTLYHPISPLHFGP